MAHIPFVHSADATSIDFHLVRSNPIARLARDTDLPAVISVSGPDSYISPDWYRIDDQVPTWNYIAAHIRGRLTALSQDQLRDILDRTSDVFENQLAPKTPWTSDKMSDGVMDKMLRAIVPFQLKIDDIQSTWKLNQNKDDAVRESAAQHVATDGLGFEVESLANFMRNLPESS